MKIYAIYKSSKGRKDIAFLTTDKDYAIRVAKNWSKNLPQFKYRVYEIIENTVIYDIKASKQITF